MSETVGCRRLCRGSGVDVGVCVSEGMSLLCLTQVNSGFGVVDVAVIFSVRFGANAGVDVGVSVVDGVDFGVGVSIGVSAGVFVVSMSASMLE